MSFFVSWWPKEKSVYTISQLQWLPKLGFCYVCSRILLTCQVQDSWLQLRTDRNTSRNNLTLCLFLLHNPPPLSLSLSQYHVFSFVPSKFSPQVTFGHRSPHKLHTSPWLDSHWSGPRLSRNNQLPSPATLPLSLELIFRIWEQVVYRAVYRTKWWLMGSQKKDRMNT